MKPEKTFYSFGQNKAGKWEVCLVDFWQDGKASIFQIDEFDSEEEAKESANKLERQRVEKRLNE